MAYVTIHAIKNTLKKAIDYVCDPKKTDNQKNISSKFCDFRTADKMFDFTRKRHSSNSKLLAFHVVQSFKKDEVTTEKAMEIGHETMKRFLNDEYEYVIATHSDTGIIHNHIIVNSVNMISGNAFSSEYDRKRYPAWKILQKISDEILVENGLSVIEQTDKTGKSHYEWSMEKQGTSWKSKLKKAIDETIRTADNFDSFIAALRSQNITVRYEPYKTKEGMILAFKMPEQKYFIYSEKLGKYYHEDRIKERIANAVKGRNMTVTERRQERILNDNGKLKKLYDITSFDSIGLQKWTENQNRKIKMQTLNELHNKGFYSEYEFDKYYTDLQNSIAENLTLYDKLKQQKNELSAFKRYMEIYSENKEIYDYYKNKTYYPERYFRLHESEIMLFEEAQAELKKMFGKIPSMEQFDGEYSYIEEQLEQIVYANKELRRELNSLETLKGNLDIIYDKEPVRKAEKQPTERSEPQRKRQRSDDFKMEI